MIGRRLLAGGSSTFPIAPPVSVFYAPHQDDESLFMGLAIANRVIAGDEVHAVLMTTGENSFAYNILTGSGGSCQPTSANTRVGAGADYGVQKRPPSIERVPMSVMGLFVATEAGSHGFRPVYFTNSGTLTICNASSSDDDVTLQFIVEKLGAPA